PLNLGEYISLLLHIAGQRVFASAQLRAAESFAHGQKVSQALLAEFDCSTAGWRHADCQVAQRQRQSPEIGSEAACYRASRRSARSGSSGVTRSERESFASFDVDREFVLVNRLNLSVSALRVGADDRELISYVVFEHSRLFLCGGKVGGVEERHPARQLPPDR